MSFQITEAFVEQFRSGLTHRAQQMESRLRSRVTVDSGIVGTSASRDYVGTRRPAKRVNRHGDTVLRDTPHDRRWVDINVYDDADLIDDPDKVRTLTDPTNAYSVAMARGFGREIDVISVLGMLGITRTGVDGAGSSTSPTTVITEGSAHGSGGEVEFEDLVDMKRIFDSREQPEMRHWAVTAQQVEDLMLEDKVQSSDYNAVRVLASGMMNSYMGFDWIRVESPILPLNAAGTRRRTVVWVTEAVWLAFGADVTASIDRRPDKNNSTQVFYSADLGAARLDDNGVVEREYDEP